MKRMKKAFIFFLIFALLAGVLPKNALAQPVSENEKKPQEIHFAESVVYKTINDSEFTMEVVAVGDWGGEVRYESSNSEVAYVDSGTGEVIIGCQGIAIITATAPETDYFYEGTASYTLYVDTIHAEATGYDGPYDGQPHGISVTVYSPENAVVKFDTEEDGEYTMTESPTYTNVSENGEAITVYYTVRVEGDEYDDAFGSATVLISKAEISITAENQSSYAGEGIKKLTYAVSGGYVSGDNLGITLTTTATKDSDPGEYPISVSWNENANYTAELKSGIYTILVNSAEQKDPELTAPEAETTLTYNGTVQSLVKAGEATGGTLQYALSSDSSTAPESGWSTAVPTATAAGTYNVWYRVIGGLEYKDIAAECISVVIAQAEITIAAEDKSGYEGDEIQKLTYRVTGSYVTGDELGVSVTTAAKEDSAAGNYPINVSWNGNANYKAKLQDGVYTIAKKGESESSGDPKKPEEGHKEEPESEKEIAEKKNPEVKQPPAAKESLVYSGTAQELVTAGEVNGGTLEYALSSDSSTAPESGWSTDVPKAAAADTYNVWYRVKGDTGYKDIAPACIRSSIAKADITITAEDKSGYEGDEIQKLTYRVTGSYVTGDELGVNVTTTATKEKSAGTYAINVSWSGNANYTAVLKNGVYSIVKKEKPVIELLTAQQNLVYTGEKQVLVRAENVTGGTLEYALSSDGSTVPESGWSTDVPIAAAAGTYNVWYRVKGDTGYKDIAPACIRSSIEKADITITAEDKSSDEGDEIQKLTYRVTGSYVTGDELGVNVMTAATKESAAGTYAISVSWNENTNYAAVLIDGVYTIVGTGFEVKPPAARENLVYTGEAQALVTPGLAANGIMHYALGDNTGANTEYSTKLPFVTDAGTYYVWYKVKREAPGKDTEAACIIVSIGKAAPEIIAEPAANQLVYTGTEQELVTAGTVKGGTYQYAMGTDEYEEEIPGASAVGDYMVKYKVIGDKNHTDGEEQSISVKITYSGASALPYIDSETTELHLVKGQQFTLSETGWTVAKNKYVSISKKGALKAKKVTDSPVEITNGERIIKVYVTAPEMEKKISIEMGTSVKAPFKYDSEHLSVTWYSQSPETATVSDDGTIVGESKGKATVVAYIGGKAYNCKVTVGESTPALERTVYITVGSKKTIKISKTKVSTWTVDDEDIAVANKKKITAKAVGETTVHGIDENDGKEYIIHLIVEDLSIISKGVNLAQKNKYKVTLAPGEALSIEFKSMIQPVFFKSNKSEIAYDNGTGTIVANKTGKAKLTTKINGKTITITVTVE